MNFSELTKGHRVIRQCAYEEDGDKRCYFKAGFGGKMNVCFCSENLCNSSEIRSSSFLMLLLIISFSLILSH